MINEDASDSSSERVTRKRRLPPADSAELNSISKVCKNDELSRIDSITLSDRTQTVTENNVIKNSSKAEDYDVQNTDISNTDNHVARNHCKTDDVSVETYTSTSIISESLVKLNNSTQLNFVSGINVDLSSNSMSTNFKMTSDIHEPIKCEYTVINDDSTKYENATKQVDAITCEGDTSNSKCINKLPSNTQNVLPSTTHKVLPSTTHNVLPSTTHNVLPSTTHNVWSQDLFYSQCSEAHPTLPCVFTVHNIVDEILKELIENVCEKCTVEVAALENVLSITELSSLSSHRLNLNDELQKKMLCELSRKDETSAIVMKDHGIEQASIYHEKNALTNSVSTNLDAETLGKPLDKNSRCRVLIDNCIKGIGVCLQRYQHHYKSLYRLAYLYSTSKYHKVRTCI